MSKTTRFQNVIEGQQDLYDPMPFVHVTDAYSFVDISKSGVIDPQPCRVFGTPLTYMFYGRPSYPTKHEGSNFLTANLPIALIFDPSKVSAVINATFPFDTGAFSAGLFKNFFHSKSQIEHFRMDSGVLSARQIVSYFYIDNNEYYYGGSRKNVEVPRLNFEIEGVHELARLTSNQKGDGSFSPDTRSSSIELQFIEAIPIKENILGIVLPQICLDDDAIASSVAEFRCKTIETYHGIHNTNPAHLLGILFEKTANIYRGLGLLR